MALSHAQRIANNTGARTVVPDLYKGKLGLTAEVSHNVNTQIKAYICI